MCVAYLLLLLPFIHGIYSRGLLFVTLSFMNISPLHRPPTPIPEDVSPRPVRPVISGRLSSWASLDDRVLGAPVIPLDTFERLRDGSYRRVGSVGDIQRVGAPDIESVIPPVTHRMGWRTFLQIFGVLVAMSTATIASVNLYTRLHGDKKV